MLCNSRELLRLIVSFGSCCQDLRIAFLNSEAIIRVQNSEKEKAKQLLLNKFQDKGPNYTYLALTSE